MWPSLQFIPVPAHPGLLLLSLFRPNTLIFDHRFHIGTTTPYVERTVNLAAASPELDGLVSGFIDAAKAAPTGKVCQKLQKRMIRCEARILFTLGGL